MNAKVEVKEQTQDTTPPESPESVPTPPPEDKAVDVDFAGLTDHYEQDDDSDAPNPIDVAAGTEMQVEAEAETPPEAPPQEPETPVKTEATQTPQAEVPPQAAEPLKQTPEVEQPAKEVAPEVPPQPQKKLEDYRKEFLPELEKFYVLPEDILAELKEADSLDLSESLGKILPKLAARMHFEMQSSILQTVGSQMMPAVQQAIGYTKNAERLENDFYSRWPKLRGQDETVVAQTIQAYMQVNPKATEKDIIERAGAMAMLHLGLDPLADTRQPTPEVPPAPPPQKPHMPANPGATGSQIFAPKKSDNFFASLADDFMKEEL